MKHGEKHLPDWADDWVPRKKCPVCKARLVVCNTWGTAVEVCSESGWALEPDLDCHPLSAPPVAPTDIRKLSACSLHGVAGCWCSISAASPAPSVGELEWRDNEDVLYSGPFVIQWRRDGGGGRYRALVLTYTFNNGDSLNEAKSLANSLQRILSGAAE